MESSPDPAGKALVYLPERLAATLRPRRPLAGTAVPETDLPLLVGRYPHLVQWAGIAIQLPPQAPLLRDGAGECRPGPRRGLAIGKRARRGDRSGHFSGPSGHPGVPERPGRGHGKRLRNTLAQIQPSCPITIQTIRCPVHHRAIYVRLGNASGTFPVQGCCEFWLPRFAAGLRPAVGPF